jgi:hypothetical protein
MLYLLDANVVITAHQQYFAVDRVPEFWSWIVHMAGVGSIKMPIETFDEVTEGPEDEKDLLYQWMRQEQVSSDLIFPDEVDQALVQKVLDVGYGADLTDDELEEIGQDPFLIAYALADPANRCVVSVEESKPKLKRKNRRVPDVCNSVGVRCINTFKLLRELDFKTNWKGAPVER